MRTRVLLASLAMGGLALAFFAIIPSTDVLGHPLDIGDFFDTGQMLGGADSRGVALADLDGDTDLDAYVANAASSANEACLNNGGGSFAGNCQGYGSATSEDVALANVDGANGPDAIVANSAGMNRVWTNNGSGQFSAGQAFDSSASQGVAAGDLDGDSDLDVFFANQGGNTVWINQSGTYSDTHQSLGTANSFSVALGDLDGDGDLDAFVGNGGASLTPDSVWINQGGAQAGTPGVFSDSGQSLGFTWTYDVALGDLDGDGDLDAFSAVWFSTGSKVWINQGGAQAGTEGVFADSMQTVGSLGATGAALADVDDDNDLDVFLTKNLPDGSQVWLNNGSAVFSDSGQALGTDTTHYEAALGDLDGDGDPDAFLASFGPNRVFRNGPAAVPTASFAVERETNPDGEQVYYQATAGNALLPIMLSNTYTATIEVHARAQSSTSDDTTVIPFTAGEQLEYLTLIDPDPDPSQPYTLTLSVTQQGVPPIPADETDRLIFFFIDGEQGLKDCVLCYVEWLGQFVGIDPIFDQLFHMSLEEQRASPLWPYYTAIFDFHSQEMSMIAATHPLVLWDALQTIDSWTPAVQALSDGSGGSYTISQEMVDDAQSLVERIKSAASPALQTTLQSEQDALDMPSFAGLNMDQAWSEIQSRRAATSLYLTIIRK